MNINLNYIKYSIYLLIAFYIISSGAKAQMTYQAYDGTVRGIEYNIAKAQYQANEAIIQSYKAQKELYSNFSPQGSIMRSRAQGVIGAKVNENYRLKVKMIILKKSSPIQPEGYERE